MLDLEMWFFDKFMACLFGLTIRYFAFLLLCGLVLSFPIYPPRDQWMAGGYWNSSNSYLNPWYWLPLTYSMLTRSSYMWREDHASTPTITCWPPFLQLTLNVFNILFFYVKILNLDPDLSRSVIMSFQY